jgi:hypothetical protein
MYTNFNLLRRVPSGWIKHVRSSIENQSIIVLYTMDLNSPPTHDLHSVSCPSTAHHNSTPLATLHRPQGTQTVLESFGLVLSGHGLCDMVIKTFRNLRPQEYSHKYRHNDTLKTDRDGRENQKIKDRRNAERLKPRKNTKGFSVCIVYSK